MTGIIRLVEVELLRRGPRHNQLLSPLTDYLAVCGDFPAGVVNVPYEQADAQNLLDDLRYTVSSAEQSDRLDVVRQRAGSLLAQMLEAVPGLGGILATDHSNAVALTHVRLVTSAAELALLPFELSKGPVGSGGVGDDWLLLQPDRPVCLTRHVRGVARATDWPLEPKILFIAGDDVPFEQHLDVFERVLAPYRVDRLRQVDGQPRHWTSDHLTVIERATLDEIRDVSAEQRFTHVHVLAHGAAVDLGRTARFGLSFGDRIVTGSELALALSASVAGERHLPSVVTLASCDSAAQGSLITPGGSVAHDLHASGIPLVVGSQFPISQQASIPFTETFYRGQLCGEHPLLSITDVRRELATEFDDEHAWASVVVYEAFPANLPQRLDELQYWQSRRAQDIALRRLEQTATSDVERHQSLRSTGRPFADDFVSPTPDRHDALVAEVRRAGADLPTVGDFAGECGGLRAAASKRTAEVAYWLSRAPDVTPDRRAELVRQCLTELEIAQDGYSTTVRSLLSTADGRVNRKVTVHWIVGQVLIMQSVLGACVDENLAGIARACALYDLDHADPAVRGWATVSMIEQAILELAMTGSSESVAARGVEAARELVRSLGIESEHATATCRQMRRFLLWWGDDEFVALEAEFGIDRPVPWDGEHGVIDTATRVLDVLSPQRHGSPGLRRSPPATPEPERLPPRQPDDTRPVPPSAPLLGHGAGDKTGVFELELLPARNGDSVWLTYGTNEALHHVLIDCGSSAAVDAARQRVVACDQVELFVLTHIDADHITGAIPLFEDPEVTSRVQEVWFNGWDQLRGFLSVAQGEQFSALLDREDRSFRWNGTEPADGPAPPVVTNGSTLPDVTLPGGLRLTVLSPTPTGLRRLASHWHAALAELEPARAMLGRRRHAITPSDTSKLDLDHLARSGPTKDASVPNLSSIAVLAEYGGRAVLLTGDAHADVLEASIRSLQTQRGTPGERLRLDALKLSHHGSANATTSALLGAIECSHYLVSTDGSTFHHPDPESMARVIVFGGPHPTLHFNYRTEINGVWDDAALQARYGYAVEYPAPSTAEAPGDGLRVVL